MPQVAPSRKFQKVPAERCTCCGRDIKEGFDVPYVGVVGPVCVHKYVALAAALAQADGLTVPGAEDMARFFAARKVYNALHNLGFEVSSTANADGTHTIHVGKRWRKDYKKIVQSWKERRAQFEADLKIAQGDNGVVKTEWVAA